MRFANPMNNYHEVGGTTFSWLWCFLFGPIYFIYKGIWSHALLCLIMAIITMGFSQLIYPFFAYTVVNSHYRRRGWRLVA